MTPAKRAIYESALREAGFSQLVIDAFLRGGRK